MKPVSLLAIIVCISLVSCKAYRNPNNLNPKYAIESLELSDLMPGAQNLLVGDEIKVVGKDQSIRYLKYTGINSEVVSGEMWKEKGKKLKATRTVQIPISEIDFINVKRKSPAATVALISGGGIIVAMGIIVVNLSFLVETTGPDNWN